MDLNCLIFHEQLIPLLLNPKSEIQTPKFYIPRHSNTPYSFFLTLRTNMCAALADDDSVNRCLTSRAWLVGAPKYPELIAVASLMFGDGIKIGLAGSQRGAQVF